MKLIVAVHLAGEGATTAGVAFDAWDAAEATRTWQSRIAHVAPPARGEPDLRVVHAVLQLFQEHRLQPELVVLDGLVHLDADDTPGPGQRLFEALGGRVPVVGVSKKGLPGLTAQFEVAREDEAPPVVVTAAGLDIGAAKARVRAMHGRKRVPTLVKLAARLAKPAD